PAPDDLVLPRLVELYEMRMLDPAILKDLPLVFDTRMYGLGLTNLKKLRKRYGLTKTRTQSHTVESIDAEICWLRAKFPTSGLERMRDHLTKYCHKWVSRAVLTDWFRINEPELFRSRQRGRLFHRRFWSAGPFDLWCVDQHDKWKKFGLRLHIGLDPFTGVIKWLKIWWTNRNPILICSYYLDAIAATGFMPLVTQSDPGTENVRLAKAHTFLRQWNDRDLAGTIQHRWMHLKKNIPPEISWSQMRRSWAPGFEMLLEEGLRRGIFSPGNPLEVLIFRYIFIPFLQSELDDYVYMVNRRIKRRDKKRVRPHGVPLHIEQRPQFYGSRSYAVAIEPEAIESARGIYAPPEHRVFMLVPDSFRLLADEMMEELGSPEVVQERVWELYLELLQMFHARGIIGDPEWTEFVNMAPEQKDRPDEEEDIPDEPIPAEQPLRWNEHIQYYGGVNGGLGQRKCVSISMRILLIFCVIS
ncbi:hypothetical protein ARMSODRAFT_887685, partial [Armillaria solidipes]